MLSDIIKKPKKDILLYHFNINEHSKRVRTKDLINELKKHGFNDYKPTNNYTQFSQISPIDTSRITNKIKNLYINNYKNIIIKKITVQPRVYLTSIPSYYEIVMQKKSYLSNSGILYIKTIDKKKIFFNYSIEATVNIFLSKNRIKKDEEISNKNIKKSSIMLDRFRAMPLQEIKKSAFQAKYNMRKNQILTTRDVVGLFLVKRGSNINITLNNLNIDISIVAKAMQNGKYGESINVMTTNGKKIKVIITGRNRAEVK